tara:strand:- start:1930 stop:4407 length:2478 start_codon:yes stop_codon:yes gene_type:complete
MAIEKDINPTVLNEQNQVPLGQEDMRVAIEAIKDRGTEGFQMQEDGSAILEASIVEEIDTDFDSNLAEVLSPQDLRNISNEIIAGIEKDKASREDWEKTYKDGLEYLGMRFDEERSEPFAGASGVIHPLLGEAVTTFQAQAYKELLPAGGPVKTQVIGAYNSLVEEQAQRVKEFMNYQITHVMEEFDEELDQMLFYLPLAGSAFKKVYYDENLGRAVSKFVAPEDLIVPYYTTDLETCPRITNVIKISENEVRKLQSLGFYRKIDISYGDDAGEYSGVKEEIEKLSGMEPSYDDGEVSVLYEVHCNLELDGFEDTDDEGRMTGVKLPYIVTIDSNSNQVLSVRRNYREDDPLKTKIEYFVHFKFLPGLGFYGFGLTHMIGGLSKASTSIMRQLIDAGTLANLPAGFKTRGIRIRDEDTPIQPGEFRDVDAPGGSLRDSIQPLPFKEPSGTLLQLLNILVNSGQKFASIAEINTGQGNPNAPVGTTLALLERSTKVLSAIHKRLHNSQKKEFRILSSVFKEYLPQEYPYAIANNETTIKLSDFDEKVDIFPISNPDIFSQSQRIAMAQEMMQLVQSNPQVHGPNGTYEAYKRMYAAIGVDNIDQILTPPPPTDPLPLEAGFENNQLLLGQQAQAFPQQNHDAHIAIHMSLLNTPPVQMNAQVQALIHSHIMQHLQMKADILGEQQMPPEVRQQFQQLQQQAQQASPQEAQNLSLQAGNLLAQFSSPILAELLIEYNQKVSAPQDEDPLVAIRKQELALKGQELSIEQQQFLAAEQRKAQEAQQRINVDRERIDTQEDIAELRDETARARLEQQRAFKLMEQSNNQQ